MYTAMDFRDIQAIKNVFTGKNGDPLGEIIEQALLNEHGSIVDAIDRQTAAIQALIKAVEALTNA